MDGTPVLDIKPYILEYDYPQSIDQSSIQQSINKLSINCSDQSDKLHDEHNKLIANFEPDWISCCKGVAYDHANQQFKSMDVINLNDKILNKKPNVKQHFEVIFTERSIKQLNLFHSNKSTEHHQDHLIEDTKNLKNFYLNFGKSKGVDSNENENSDRQLTDELTDELKDEIRKNDTKDERTDELVIKPTNELRCKYCLEFLNDSDAAKKAIINVLICDPRSSYRRQKCTDKLYFFTVDTVHISCWFDEDDKIIEIVKIKPNYL